VPTSRATRVTSAANERSWSTIVLIVFFNSRISPLTSTVIFFDRSPGRHRGRHVRDVAHLRGQVARHRIDALGQVLPRAGHTLHVGLAAETSFGADLARHAGHFGSERRELVDHRIDGVLQLQDLALDVDRDLLRQVAARHGLRHVGDVAHLSGQVARHRVDALGQILPRSRHTLHVGLPAQPAVGADLARDARHFGGERAQLVDHRVDGVLQLQDLALHVDRDLLREVAAGDRLGHVGDVAHLAGQVARHRVHAVRQVLPRSGDALDVGLPAENPLGTHFARHARHFRGERRELVDHRIDRVLQFQDLALDVHRDLLRKIAVRHGLRHVGDVAHLTRQVAGHEVHAVGQVLPRARHAFDAGLATQLALGPHLARHPRHFGRKRAELVDHRVDRVLQLEKFALDVDRDLLRQVARRDRGRHVGDVAHLCGQVACHRVHAVGQVFPRAGHAFDLRLAAELAFGADLARHARHLGGKRSELVHHLVDGLRGAQELALQRFAVDFERHRLRQIALRNGADHARRFTGGMHEVVDQLIDRVDRIAPEPGHVAERAALAELAFLADDALKRSSSCAIRSLRSTTSLNTSDTRPETPDHSSGRRTDVSPRFKAFNAPRMTVI
jgi:hypothetical protein